LQYLEQKQKNGEKKWTDRFNKKEDKGVSDKTKNGGIDFL
jgi:hypothetical protein